MAFFPNFLKMRYQLEMQAKTRAPFPESCIPKCIDILDHYRKSNTFWFPHLFLNEYNTESTDEIVDDALYEICINEELRKVLKWISKRTISTIGIDNYLSINVYTRIGTSMLNQLVDDELLSKPLNILYHDNFVRNLADLTQEINVESLPF
ncbi:hypothetical protein [Sharpea azabuensis]|uniref:hypothetical protein n=1 Tax=Sharpea azabuensis TaxID=322505 RepID=UPI00156A5570|nr:hypothetical protein [Sharpea azabuensis]